MLHNASLTKKVERLNAQYADATAPEILHAILNEGILGKSALVSSFGAESAVLLHMVSQINPDTPVVFIDTEFLFPETLEYLRTLAVNLKLNDIRRILPDPGRIANFDPNGTLNQTDANQCCYLRKTQPLHRALGEFSNWITGRKRHQAATRDALALFELDTVTNRIKVNPLYNWDRDALQAYMNEHDLPRHPLVAKGYPSIGCSPCTSAVVDGEDARAGRWRGTEKTECGIHFGDPDAIPQTKFKKSNAA